MASLLSVESHFRFGENWRDFLTTVDEESQAQAVVGLNRLFPEGLAGKTFLDIGCGSGLHLQAAAKLGASAVGVDIDPDSVAAAKSLGCQAEVCSVFDLPATQYDVVYSWGVLHHTGAMWKAVDKAASLVKPGGLFALALYRKTPMCGFWTLEKRIYRRLPKILQRAVQKVYAIPVKMSLKRQGKDPDAYIASYKSARGMSFWHDIHDWLGGYPYQSASAVETFEHMAALGFDRLRDYDTEQTLGLLGTGCFEMVFRRP